MNKPQNPTPELTCLNIDYPERTGGKCNAQERMTNPTPEAWEHKHYRFVEKYLSQFKAQEIGYSVFIDLHRDFIRSLLESERSKLLQEVEGIVQEVFHHPDEMHCTCPAYILDKIKKLE